MGRELNYWMRKPLTRRRVLGAAGGGAGLAALSVAGCGDDDEEPAPTQAPASSPAGGATSPAASPTQAAATPKRGGVFRTYLQGDPAYVDPYAGAAFGAATAYNYVYSYLMRVKTGPGIDATLQELEPDLARSVKVSEDGLTYTVELNTRAKWHPPVSRPIHADDVIFSWERFNGRIGGGPPTNPSAAANDYIESITKIDASTISFKLKTPRGNFLSIQNAFIAIMPKEAGTAFNPAQQMVGTGPWMWDSYQVGSVIKLKRNPEWHFGPEAPYFDSVEINIIPEYATRLNQFFGGNIDDIDITGNDLARGLDTVKGMQVFVGESGLPASYITFDGRPGAANAPWRDPRVRKAISMALDRDAMLDAAYNLKEIEKLNIGAKRRWNNDVASLETPYWLDPQGKVQFKSSDPKMTADNIKSFVYSPADAKKLLEAAGHANGFKTQLHTTPTQYGAAFNTLTELVQQYCAEIGVELELVADDYSSVYVNRIARQGEFDGLAHIPRGAGALSQFDIYYFPNGIRWNARVDDATVRDMITKMMQERDVEKTRLAVINLQQYLNDKMYLVPMQLGASGIYTGYQPNIRNALDYQVTNNTQGARTAPYLWKA
jgi:peptide/nickel transport system substrate-binding protein